MAVPTAKIQQIHFDETSSTLQFSSSVPMFQSMFFLEVETFFAENSWIAFPVKADILRTRHDVRFSREFRIKSTQNRTCQVLKILLKV